MHLDGIPNDHACKQFNIISQTISFLLAGCFYDLLSRKQESIQRQAE